MFPAGVKLSIPGTDHQNCTMDFLLVRSFLYFVLPILFISDIHFWFEGSYFSGIWLVPSSAFALVFPEHVENVRKNQMWKGAENWDGKNVNEYGYG